MSIDPFPARVAARKLCDGNGTINSSIPLGKLLRLSEYLDDQSGQAEVCLSFDRDASGCCCLTGTVSASVNMVCQRCLDVTKVELASALDIKIAGTEKEAQRIAESSADPLEKLEVVVCDDGEFDLLSIVEDELIMSLPIVAVHDNEQCNAALNSLQNSAENPEPDRQGNIKGLDVLEKLRQELQQESENQPGNKTRKD